MSKYPFETLEPKWQKYWEENQTFRVTEDPSVPEDKRLYVLDMFPYPSASGLHVGHPEGYTATDIWCRMKRHQGYNVLHPMGFDSFGLPAENYAIKTGTHPLATTEDNIARFRKQIRSLGFCYDWDREVSTHTVEYYRWTQWIFLQLFKRGLAYEAKLPVWYCPEMGTVLANEEVVTTAEGPRSERGNHPVERRSIRQWVLKITAYADRLLEDLETLDWSESIKAMQRNWIGRSEGANVKFKVAGSEEEFWIFTTRPDTLAGVTYMVLAPDHALVEKITTPAQKKAVDDYVFATRNKSDLERTDLAKDKTGVFTGAYAVNPLTGKEVPVWISDYVLASYGFGAIMAVPAHDDRDWAFAKKFGLPVTEVISRDGKPTPGGLKACFAELGIALNSGKYDGLKSEDFKKKITQDLEEAGLGTKAVNYKLRDWNFSRQRYWGEPIPVVHCEKCGIVPLDEKDLPLTLPEVSSYKPTGTGESPLAAIDAWVNTTCPCCGGQAKRETNTMPQWAGSCWYYLRYIDPHNTSALADPEKIKYWMPVNLYVGGAEHAVLHLLYSRFWHKVLYDIGVVNTKEPYQRLVNQGMILGENGVKMSKSLGNVINPDDIVRDFGADTLRLYEMFMGPLQDSKPWNSNGVVGVHRFLNRVWALTDKPLTDAVPTKDQLRILHKTIKKVTQDTDSMLFNTAISAMMVMVNELTAMESLPRDLWKPFVLLLSPYAPHLAEELWEMAGGAPSAASQKWPVWDDALCQDDEVTIAVQVNGKLRGDFKAPAGIAGPELEKAARAQERVKELLEGKEVVKTILVPGKLVNFVIKG